VCVLLAALRDAALVASTIAHALGVQDSGQRPIQDALIEALRARQAVRVRRHLAQLS